MRRGLASAPKYFASPLNKVTSTRSIRSARGPGCSTAPSLRRKPHSASATFDTIRATTVKKNKAATLVGSAIVNLRTGGRKKKL